MEILHGLQSAAHILLAPPTSMNELASLLFDHKLSQMQYPSMRENVLGEQSVLAQKPFSGTWEELLLDTGIPAFELTHGVTDREKGNGLEQRVNGYRYTIKSGVVKFVAGQHTPAFTRRWVRGGQGSKRL